MNRTIDVATTATLRPKLYERTLRSFKPLFDQHANWRLILNIDLAGNDGVVGDVLDIATRYFPEVDCIRAANKPDFRLAWRWCVGRLQNEYVLWLEDDWELIGSVDLGEMLSILDDNQDLATLRLPRWNANADGTFRQWNKRSFDGWNGRFVDILPTNVTNCGYSNNPSLTRREFLQPVLPHLKPDMCPEKQINGFNSALMRWIHSWRYGVFQHPNDKLVVRDIGESWRKARRYGKGDKMRFSTWEVEDGRRKTL